MLKYLKKVIQCAAAQRVGVNVYDNGKLVQGSPFSSYTQAALALGNINVSSVISKKIDTDKLYKGRYKFESSV